VQRSLV